MKAIVCGLGRVGLVTVAGLIRDGHQVVGVDTAPALNASLAKGIVPFREPGVSELIREGLAQSRLRIAPDLSPVADADVVFGCVGTRGTDRGSLDLTEIRTLAAQLGGALRSRPETLDPVLVVFRSTMLPGSIVGTVLPEIAAAAGEPPGSRYEVVHSPEFSREGSALQDWTSPSRIVVGERHPGAASPFLKYLATSPLPVFITSYEVAELAKLADNSFHALKVAFANEIGRLALSAGMPTKAIFDIFLADSRLNISPAYLQPGGPFGGPCLPKDVAALATYFAELGIDAPVIGHIVASNQSHADFLLAEIVSKVPPKAAILLLGLSFKKGTDDLRFSPLASLAEALIGRGYDLSIFDPEIDRAALEAEMDWLAPRMIYAIPSGQHWDLALVGKHLGEAEAALSPTTPRFRLDRL